MKRLVCLIIGHGRSRMFQDGRGAAWHRCSRCGALTGAHSYHGGQPWKEQR